MRPFSPPLENTAAYAVQVFWANDIAGTVNSIVRPGNGPASAQFHPAPAPSLPPFPLSWDAVRLPSGAVHQKAAAANRAIDHDLIE